MIRIYNTVFDLKLVEYLQLKDTKLYVKLKDSDLITIEIPNIEEAENTFNGLCKYCLDISISIE